MTLTLFDANLPGSVGDMYPRDRVTRCADVPAAYLETSSAWQVQETEI